MEATAAPTLADDADTDPDPDLPRRTGTQAIERAIAILRMFSGEQSELTLTELARGTGLRPSTAHRIVRALCYSGIAVQDEWNERYRLGPASLVLFQAAMGHFGFAGAAPELESLARATSESVSIGVLDGSDVVVLMQTPSTHGLRFERAPGTRIPVHVSAMGKVLLAFADDDPKVAVDGLGRLERFTDQTITRKRDLIVALHRIRQQNWALNDQERYDGVRAIAVPLRDANGRIRAAVGVQGYAGRLDDARIEALLPTVQEQAVRIGRAVHLERL